MADHSFHEELKRAEARRCRALVAGDVATLDTLLAEPLVHVHGSGQIDDRQAYLDGVANRLTFHQIDRGDLRMNLYGDVAVVSGPISQTVSLKGSAVLNQRNGVATQIWIRRPSGWKQSICVNIFDT